MFKIIILSILVLLFSARAYFRTMDWRNSTELFLSALRDPPNDMYRALRLEILAGICQMDPTQLNKRQCLTFLNDGLHYLNNVLVRVDKPAPEIIRFYGLDQHSEKAKMAYVLSFVLMEQKEKNPYAPLEPYMKEVTDTQIVHHYLSYLIQNNRLDDIEELCKRAIAVRKSPPALIGLSIVEQRKYKNIAKAEAYLIEAHAMFPYDVVVLQECVRFYNEIKSPAGVNYYLKLHALRVHQEGKDATVFINKKS